MANTYVSSGSLLTGNAFYQTIYSVPSGQTALVKSIYCVNHGTGIVGTPTGDRAVSARWTNFNDNNRANYIIHSGVVPYQSALNIVDGVIVLESRDSIQAYADSGRALDVFCSVMQIS